MIHKDFNQSSTLCSVTMCIVLQYQLLRFYSIKELMNEHGAMMKYYRGKLKVLQEKPVPAPLYPS